MSTTTNLTNLKINYLTQAQYDAALEDNEINENEIYLTPSAEKTSCMAQGSSTTVTLTAGVVIQVPLTTYIANNETHLTFNSTKGGIEVLTKGIYRVTAGAYIPTGGATHGVYVDKASNTGNYADASEILGATEAKNGTGSVCAGPILVQLEKNDILYLAARSIGAAGTCTPNNNATFLLVEFIDAN